MRSKRHRTLSRRALAVALLSAAAAIGAGSCSDSPEASQPVKDGGAEGSGATGATGGVGATGGASGGTGGSAANGGGGAGGTGGSACPWVSPPDDVPDGWERYPIFECQYPVYYPPTAAHLPSPLAWKECAELGPDPYTCRELVVDWETMPGYAVAGGSRGSVNSAGDVLLQLRKSYVKPGPTGVPGYLGVMAMVAEADGPIRQAYWISSQALSALTAGSKQFWFAPMGINGGKSSWDVKEYWGTVGFVRTAAVAGDDTDVMQPILGEWKMNDPLAASLRPGAKYYGLFSGTLRIKSWDGSEDFGTVYAGGMDLGDIHWVGDVAVFEATLTAMSKLLSWTPADGLRTLLGYDNDFTQAAANLSTDGVDLVWVHGKDRTSGDGPYPTAELVTAKFTTDPAKLVPKRVRSYPSGYIWGGGGNSVTGCGHAAYHFVVDAQINDYRLLIVRLSDGVAWALRSAEDEQWTWAELLAMTCDELFVTVHIKGSGDTLRRVRLDSLGPGLQPD